MTTRICLIRHGETDWNAAGRIQGQTDVPLNEVGRSQALALAASVPLFVFNAIYSSDLIRALDSAQGVAERCGLEVISLPLLRERHFGIFQGLTAEEGLQRYPEAHDCYKARDVEYDFVTGESMLRFNDRVHEAVACLTQLHPGQTIAAVSHGGVLEMVYRKATGRPLQTPRDFVIPNCALNWFSFDEHGWHLEAWDDHRHLAKVMLESVE